MLKTSMLSLSLSTTVEALSEFLCSMAAICAQPTISKGSPLSVETAHEFTEFDKKIGANKVSTVNIVSDMVHVEAKCAKAVSASAAIQQHICLHCS